MSISEIQQKILRECDSFSDWTDKYRYLIEQAKNLPPMSSSDKTEKTLISGCQVRAWFKAEYRKGKMCYQIDSDSQIVRGIIALLIQLFSEQTPEDIMAADLYLLGKIGLNENFMPTDPSNLQKIMVRIKEAAKNYVKN
jgi:cysteine desulfuration protein SufE